MDNETLARLAASILTLAPDFPMCAEEIQERVKARGIDGFLREAGGHAAALSQITELLSRPAGRRHCI
jgi:hypothetical protein